MERTQKVVVLVLLLTTIVTILPQKIYGDNLSPTFLRLSRISTGSATGGTLCATTPPAENGSENSLQIIFPSGFTVNANPGNWTVSVTNLPAGGTAWPGIGTATSVSGKVVTFPSSNLSPNTQYCFNFSYTNTLITPSSTGTYNGTVLTKNSLSQTIDNSVYGLSIVNSNQINVTAIAPAKPTDFLATLASSSNGTFRQDDIIDYAITYESHLPYPTDITVEAEWDPTILGYVVGTASNAYGNVTPIIDIANHKIDWTITAFQTNTENKVHFSLKTNSVPTATIPVSFSVSGRVISTGTTTPDSTISSVYKYVKPVQTGGNTITPTETANITSTPPPLPNQFKPQIYDIQIRTISSSNATITTTTNKNTRVDIKYGTSKNSLDSKVEDTIYSSQHLITLPNLKPDTRYYFKITTTDENGTTMQSDIYLLDTAAPSVTPLALIGSLTITSGDVVLADNAIGQNAIPEIVIPKSTPYSFKFKIQDYKNIKQIQAIIRNADILGVNTSEQQVQNGSASITEIGEGYYVGRLTSNPTPGKYQLIIQIHDYNGNISEEKIGDLYIVSPLMVVDAVSKRGIENVKIVLSLFNRRLRTYEEMTSSISPIKNPIFTGNDGYIPTILPEGKYRAQVSVLGYKPVTIDFEINASSNSFYPSISLKPLPFSMTTQILYSYQAAQDLTNQIQEFLHSIRTSFRFFDLIAVLMLSFLVMLLTITTSKKLSVPIRLLPYFTYYHILSYFKKSNLPCILHGSVIDMANENIGGVLLYITFPNGKVITHTKTNGFGEFFTKIHKLDTVKIIVSKKGYKSLTRTITKKDVEQKILIQLSQISRPRVVSLSSCKWYLEYILSSLFEAFLVLSLLLELLFIAEFGFLQVLPFLVISLINVIMWAVTMRGTRI